LEVLGGTGGRRRAGGRTEEDHQAAAEGHEVVVLALVHNHAWVAHPGQAEALCDIGGRHPPHLLVAGLPGGEGDGPPQLHCNPAATVHQVQQVVAGASVAIANGSAAAQPAGFCTLVPRKAPQPLAPDGIDQLVQTRPAGRQQGCEGRRRQGR
jgi:hypothetical protein